jgi:hypothetical protein
MTARTGRCLAAVVAVVAACKAPDEGAVRRWLRCEECNRGELEAVVKQGDAAVGLLSAAAIGPPKRERERVRIQSQDRYARLHPSMPESVYVAHYDSNFVANYQAHALVSLNAIATPAAKAALYQAMQNDSIYRRDVLRALARVAPVRLTLVAGDSQAAPVDSTLRTDPSVRVTDSVTGQPLSNIRVVFTVDSGGGGVLPDSVRRTDSAGIASVRWSLDTVADSFNVLTARVLRRTARFEAMAHGLQPRLVFVAQPTIGTLGQPLLPVVQVAVVDAWNQPDTTFSGLAVASILGTAIQVATPVVAGRASFPNLIPPNLGSGFRIRVALLGTTPVVSQPFDVVP